MKRAIMLTFLLLIVLNPIVTSANDKSFYVTALENVEVKNEPLIDSETIGELEQGINVKVLNVINNELNEAWYEISYDGTIGWINDEQVVNVEENNADQTLQESINIVSSDNVEVSSTIKEIPTEGIISTNTSIRKGATDSYNVVMELKVGQTVEIIDHFINTFDELWYRVNVDGVLGWVKALDIDTNLVENNDEQLAGESTAVLPSKEKVSNDIEVPSTGIISNNAPMRKGATDSYNVVMELKVGQTVEIIDHFINTFDELWYRVNVDGVLGWVKALNIEPSSKDSNINSESTNNLIPVRKGATSSYDVSFYISKNGTYKVLALFTNANNELWYRINYNNKFGWVKADDIWRENSNIKLDLKTINSTIVRKGAATSYEIVKFISPDEFIRVIDTFINASGDTWYRVNSGGQYGWIHAGHVNKDQPLPNNISDGLIPVRKGATSSYQIVEYLSNKTSIEVIDFFKNGNNELWYRISSGNTIGWVNSSNIWESNNSIKLIMTTLENTVIRSGATTAYKAVSNITPNKKITIIDSFVNFLGEEWYRIQYNGTFGWIHSSTVNKNVPSPMNITSIPIRKGAAVSYDIVSYLGTSETTQVLSQFIDVNNELWYRISANGTLGWVNSNNVWEDSNSVSLVMKYVNNNKGVIRKGASTSYNTLRAVNPNESLTVIDSFVNSLNERWYRVSSNGEYGWIHESTVNSLVDSDSNYPNMFSNGNGVNVRKGAAVSYESIMELSFNEEIKIVDLFVNAYGEIWYRGEFSPTLLGWIKGEYLELEKVKNKRYTNYDISFEQALNIQSGLKNPIPQTDAPLSEAYISSTYVEIVGTGIITGHPVNLRTEPNLTSNVAYTVSKGTGFEFKEEVKGALHAGSTTWYKIVYQGQTLYVHSSLASNSITGKTTANVTVRSGPSTESFNYLTLPKGTLVNITGVGGNWHKITLSGWWRNASKDEVSAYMNPNNNDEFQHLLLTESVGVSKNEINKVLQGKGSLQGMGQAFIDGGKLHSVNEIYLISHALLETGNGGSDLANGSIEVGVVANNKWVSFQPNGTYLAEYKYDSANKKWIWIITKDNNFNRNNASNIKKTYNMFGIGANDGNAKTLGSIRAYQEGWYSPEQAIIGGAEFIGSQYVHNQYNQNTLYKMRWNPDSPGTHQYASDIGWAVKQVTNIKNLYNILNNPIFVFDIPRYK